MYLLLKNIGTYINQGLIWSGITLFVLCVLFVTIVLPYIEAHNKQLEKDNFDKRAIEMGFAEYTTDSGKFYWINKEVEYLINGKK